MKHQQQPVALKVCQAVELALRVGQTKINGRMAGQIQHADLPNVRRGGGIHCNVYGITGWRAHSQSKLIEPLG